MRVSFAVVLVCYIYKSTVPPAVLIEIALHSVLSAQTPTLLLVEIYIQHKI